MTESTWNKLRAMEQSVLDGCTEVLTCTPLVQEEFQAQTKTPVEMITNGFDEEDFTGPVPTPDGHFNITHTGLFASDGNPFTLWKVLEKMASSVPGFREDLRIRLVGKVDRVVLDAIKAAGLADNVVALGSTDHATAVREQRSASILILPLRNDPLYKPILPGKLFEYLASRRPILGIGQEDGAMARVIFDAKAGITADWDESAAMRAFIANAWQQHCDGGVPETAGEIDQYSRRSTAHQLATLLNNITDSSLRSE